MVAPRWNNLSSWFPPFIFVIYMIWNRSKFTLVILFMHNFTHTRAWVGYKHFLEITWFSRIPKKSCINAPTNDLYIHQFVPSLINEAQCPFAQQFHHVVFGSEPNIMSTWSSACWDLGLGWETPCEHSRGFSFWGTWINLPMGSDYPVLHCDHWIHTHPTNTCMVWHLIRTSEMVFEIVIECNLLSLQAIYSSRGRKHAGKIIDAPFHPRHRLFHIFPSRRRLRVITVRKAGIQTAFLQTAFCLSQWCGPRYPLRTL